MGKFTESIKKSFPDPPEFSDQEIERLKEMIGPSWNSRRTWLGGHLKTILNRKRDPSIKLSHYHLISQVGIKKYLEQEGNNGQS